MPPEPIDRRRLILSAIVLPATLALCMFVPAGTWAWAKGWLFIAVLLALSAGCSFYLWRVNPDIFAARINAHEGTKSWDRLLLSLLFPAMLAIFPVAALDDARFHWLPLSWWAVLLGYVLLVGGMVLMTWAEAVNRFFEPTVRLQTDRGQVVIDTGPYAFVRHPGYASALPLLAGLALCLGSVWALIPAAVAAAVLIVRTQLEDQTLRAELPGYKEYTRRVRFRLLPGIW